MSSLPFVRVGYTPKSRAPRTAPMDKTTNTSPPGAHQHHLSSSSSRRRSSFAHPPVNPSGVLLDASDRPLLCLSLSEQQEEIVVGSADHALYAYHLRSGKPTRKLYTRSHGHIDWVNCVVHTEDGQVLSGGSDGKICLWPAARGGGGGGGGGYGYAASSSSSSSLGGGGPRRIPTSSSSSRSGSHSLTSCQDLDGHASGVSKIAAVPQTNMAFSSGYDGKIKLWDLKSKRALTFSAETSTTSTHTQTHSSSALDPVMDFTFDSEQEQLVSGTRKGTSHVWDLKTADLIGSLRQAHRGPVSCVMKWSESTIVTGGGEDGMIKIWDTRRGLPLCVHRVEAHAHTHTRTKDGTTTTTSKGNVTCLEKAGGLLATGGSDKRVCILDPRVNFKAAQVMEHHQDAVFVMKYVNTAESPVLFSGDGKGMLLATNLFSFQLVYGLQANRGGVRAVATVVGEGEKKMVVAGEDGKALIYDF